MWKTKHQQLQQPTLKSHFWKTFRDIGIVVGLFFLSSVYLLPRLNVHHSERWPSTLDQAAGELVVAIPATQQPVQPSSPANPVQKPLTTPVYIVRIPIEPVDDGGLPSWCQRYSQAPYCQAAGRQALMDRSRSDRASAVADAKRKFPDLTDEQISYFLGPEAQVVAAETTKEERGGAVETIKREAKNQGDDVDRLRSSMYFSVNGQNDWFHSPN